MKKALRLLSLFLTAIVITGGPLYAAMSQENFDKANSLYEEGKYEEALSFYLEIEKTGEHWKLFYNTGNCYYKLKNYLKAKIYYLKAERLNPFEPSVRKNIGIVMQEPFLFNGTILDNIRYACPTATFGDVVRAARAARAHEFILAKEDGYDTYVGEGGAALSGGEKQRIAIAQAILHDPPILILDEATSSVDSETEKAIQEAIANLIKNRTVVAIAHRLATLKNANRLIVVEDGLIAETGTHDELMATDGIYARLVKIQSDLSRLTGGVLQE